LSYPSQICEIVLNKGPFAVIYSGTKPRLIL
jgi:hypothetical protein